MKNYKNLRFIQVNENYLDYLRKFEPRISHTKNEKQNRKFIGMLFKINSFLYYAPLTHINKKSNLTNFKLKNQQNNHLATVLFNNMIPLYESAIVDLDINKIEDTKYRNLLYDEYRYMKKFKNRIIEKAKKVYNGQIPDKLKQVCFNFKNLEKICEQYFINQKLKNELKFSTYNQNETDDNKLKL